MSKRALDSDYMGRLQEHSGIKRNKKACTECRQQKVRCNASVDSKEPCSRCRRMDLKCVISDPFKREHKRQRLSELEAEAYELRRRLEEAAWSSTRIPTPTISMESTINTISPALTNHSTSPPAITTVPVNNIVSPPADEVLDIKTPPISPTGTLPRTLDGITVSAGVIDELFQMFFTDFYQFLPIFDPKVTPNEYWGRSQFLFWAITGVASRKYAKDPTLLDSLGERVLNMSLLSLRTPSIAVIKGLLLILTWPLPKNSASADATYAISGSLLHMAMQIGLHIPTSSQDFSRVKVNLTERQILKRAELWGYCVVSYQRSCSFKGHSPLALLETYQDSEQRHTLFQRISDSLRFQLRLNGVVTRCCSALLQNGLRMMTPEQAHALDVLIRVFEANLKDTEPEAATDIDKFYHYVARLTVQAFHFYKEPSKKIPTFMITRMYTSAVAVLRHLDRMDNAGTIKLAAAPFYCVYATSLASFTILRLLKGSTVNYMDENAKEDFFLGVNVMKRLSTENNDGPSRLSLVMTQLWNSEKAFKNPDGTEHLSLRIRTRLAMSPVFDAIWWWREEFGGQQGAYSSTQFEDDHQEKGAALPDSGAAIDPAVQTLPMVPTGGQAHDMTSFLDDHLLAELGWTNSNNFLYTPIAPAVGPYGSDWYSPTEVNGFAI